MSMLPCIVCGSLTPKSRCPRHELRNGSTRAWRRTRTQILTRDGYRCRIPRPDGNPCGQPATHVDHIRPVSKGGSDDPANLRAACARCNLRRRDSLT